MTATWLPQLIHPFKYLGIFFQNLCVLGVVFVTRKIGGGKSLPTDTTCKICPPVEALRETSTFNVLKQLYIALYKQVYMHAYEWNSIAVCRPLPGLSAFLSYHAFQGGCSKDCTNFTASTKTKELEDMDNITHL